METMKRRSSQNRGERCRGDTRRRWEQAGQRWGPGFVLRSSPARGRCCASRSGVTPSPAHVALQGFSSLLPWGWFWRFPTSRRDSGPTARRGERLGRGRGAWAAPAFKPCEGRHAQTSHRGRTASKARSRITVPATGPRRPAGRRSGSR